MKKHLYIGIYIGMIFLEQDLNYQNWLKAGRPVSFLPQIESARKTK